MQEEDVGAIVDGLPKIPAIEMTAPVVGLAAAPNVYISFKTFKIFPQFRLVNIVTLVVDVLVIVAGLILKVVAEMMDLAVLAVVVDPLHLQIQIQIQIQTLHQLQVQERLLIAQLLPISQPHMVVLKYKTKVGPSMVVVVQPQKPLSIFWEDQ